MTSTLAGYAAPGQMRPGQCWRLRLGELGAADVGLPQALPASRLAYHHLVRVHAVVPQGFDDPGQPTGGNIYDRRICAGLPPVGWQVLVSAVAGQWPAPGPAARDELARVLAAIPDGELALADGLIASTSAAQLAPHAGRTSLVVLLHMPLATALDPLPDAAALRSERAVLRAAAGVIVTSEWTRRQVLARYQVPPRRVHVARPGADQVHAAAQPVPGQLLCVAAVAPHKGQDVLVEALARLGHLPWQCVLAGPADRNPGFTSQLQARITALGYGHRIRLAGILGQEALSDAYAAADVLVAPSRSETYGMAVTEALAHGVPVIAADVGGLPEALGFTPDGTRPGQLVPPGDPAALAAAISGWLTSENLRLRLRTAVASRRTALPSWQQTTQEVAGALAASMRR